MNEKTETTEFDSPWKDILKAYLPEPLEIQFWQEVYQLEEERQVSYITSVERIGFERGLLEGRQEGKQEGRQEGESTLILRLLNRRIGQIPANLVETIQQLPIEQLEIVIKYPKGNGITRNSKTMMHHFFN